MIKDAFWIGVGDANISSCPEFSRKFFIDKEKEIKRAELSATALGVYEASINGCRVGNFVLAPGCTSYKKRLQYETYDVTEMLLRGENKISILVGAGWYRGRISAAYGKTHSFPAAVISELTVEYGDGEIFTQVTDESWRAGESRILASDIYDGETYDASFDDACLSPSYPAKLLDSEYADFASETLVSHEGEYVTEHERIKPCAYFITPKGERVVDFGQNLAGYVEISVNAKLGDKIEFTHAETLDREENFYRDNYRGAEAKATYICRDGNQTYKPHFTFYGFRYIKLLSCPEYVNPQECLTAVAIYSDMKRTGYFSCGNEKVNRLYENTLWSQRSNFIDIPTDCPQRDERMGWTGDAQVFATSAAYNYDVFKFFRKWLRDLCAEQRENGAVTEIVPNFWNLAGSSAAWGDAAAIIPWEMYLAYGDESILDENFQSVKKWVDFITNDTKDPYLWTCCASEKRVWGKHYGDWLALDAPAGSYKGASDDDFIASVFYCVSVRLLTEYGHVLGRDVSEYEELAKKIRDTFVNRFSPVTETEHVLALYFDMTDDAAGVAAALNEMIKNDGYKLSTGFVGTPYLLYVLSENGYAETAYSLLLREEYPSWLYEVNHGATTIWEHWDGINDEGDFWSADMNSFNHYAYGSVIGWLYEVAAGIAADKKNPGFSRPTIKPRPDKRLGHAAARLETRYGTICSEWTYTADGCVKYKISVPTDAVIIIGGERHEVSAGEYEFLSRENFA
ncbi:MAG: glycoside hydrolase family 78 protein [Firmicutes bacterium]|nr:glycoside hydrolase family 78 protein [Bacillota bacterium]